MVSSARGVAGLRVRDRPRRLPPSSDPGDGTGDDDFVGLRDSSPSLSRTPSDLDFSPLRAAISVRSGCVEEGPQEVRRKGAEGGRSGRTGEREKLDR